MLADDATLVARYRANYGLEGEAVGIEQVRFHMDLERRLTAELMNSTAADRWDVFERCYTDLYEQLPWLADTGASVDVVRWSKIIGPAPQRVFEVGSGAGKLASELARAGYNVVATDVSRKRGGERPEEPGLEWQVTDGVHLADHAASGTFDTVLSDQVIEHLHPDDVAAHFEGAFRLLKPGGKYAFRTPHALTGPHDVSLVFGEPRPVGMHLREYLCGELAAAAAAAGFKTVRSVATLSGLPRATRVSGVHFRYVTWLEHQRWARRARIVAALKASKLPLRPDVWLVASLD